MSSPRPACLVVVAGTTTGVGKTWFTAATAARLRAAGHTVAARKPVQSYDPADPATDAAVLGAATGEPVDIVCPPGFSYEAPLAPPMAADVLGRPCPRLTDLLDAVTWPSGVAFGFVETVGGPRSPIADDGDSAALARALAPDLMVLVADAALGAVNAVRLCMDVLPGRVVVALNRFDDHDDTHRRNAAWLAERDGLHVVTSSDGLATYLVSLFQNGEA